MAVMIGPLTLTLDLKIIVMKIYEVVFTGTLENLGNDWDTCFLVRAPDFRAAMEEVMVNGTKIPKEINPNEKPRVIHEIGIDLATGFCEEPKILRGPYMQCAYNYCWKCWLRKIEDDHYIDEWEEIDYWSKAS